jgi:hypothetical protein
VATTGFGKQKTNGAASKSTAKRESASRKYDQMQADGLPEFTIFIRIQGKNNWFPVGSLAVNRSNKINQAIYEQEAELLKGAIRLFPILRKHQNQLEYGYRLKQFPDEPIQVAVRPQPGTGNLLRSSINQFKDRVVELLKRS